MERIDFDSKSALVVLGRNFLPGWKRRELKDQIFHLSPDSRINVLAAGMIYKSGVVDSIVFSTGHTAGKDLPSEAEAMKTQLRRIFPNIPEKAIILEENSMDTESNAKEVAKILRDRQIKRVALLTTAPHLKRATHLFRKEGVYSRPISTETVIVTKWPAFIEKYMSSDLYKKILRQEKVVALIQRLPFGSQALRFIVNLTRRKN